MGNKKHKWDYCHTCDCPMVRCGTCGNNCCNAGNGCDDCDSAHALQQEHWPDKKDWPKLKATAGKQQWLIIGEAIYEMWQKCDFIASTVRRQSRMIPRGKRKSENYVPF